MPLVRILLAVALAVPCCVPIAVAGEAPAITISNAWARATPGGSTVGAAYAVIENKGAAPDRLISASSPSAGRVEIHSHAMVDGVMQMRRIDALEVPAGKSATLGPGGDHIMLFDLKGPLKAGERVAFNLTFEKAGVITAEAEIAPIGATGPSKTGAKEAAGNGAAPAADPHAGHAAGHDH